MGSFSDSIARFQQLQSVSSRLRRRLLGDPRRELLVATTDHLLLFGDSVYHLGSGKKQKLQDDYQADSIAAAASQLLDNKNGDQRVIKLFLAPSEFVATSTSMPGVAAENVPSALNLQRESLLPAYEERLVLATKTDESTENEKFALWMPANRLTRLFDAFAELGYLLASVQPRTFRVLHGDAVCNVLDDDEEDLTLVSARDGTLLSWQAVKPGDLTEAVFDRQWRDAIDSLSNVIEVSREKLNPYLEQEPVQAADYCFFPDSAIAARKKVEKKRQFALAASLLAAVLLIAAMPFILQSLELRMAEARLQAAREMSADARADQRVVVDFEDEWGTINDFPDQQVRQAMFRLQEVLGSERLSSLELNEGLIRIQGTSSDPQAILQRLEQDPMFTEVVFSRATNNTRYYIDLRLATVNFEAYMLRYFPDQS